MIPIYVDIRARRVPYITILLITLNVGAFVYQLTLNTEQLLALVATYAFTPDLLFDMRWDPQSLISLFSAMFLHGGWLHLGGNMLYLWVFGGTLENQLGKLRFLLLYLICGAAGALVHGFIYPDSGVHVLGASGAISGLLGAFLVLHPKAKVITAIPIFFIIELATLPAIFVIGMWFLLQLAQGLGSLGVPADVAWWAHLGGFALGAAAVLPRRVGGRIS